MKRLLGATLISLRVWTLLGAALFSEAALAPFTSLSPRYEEVGSFALYEVDQRPDLGIDYRTVRFDYVVDGAVSPSFDVEFGELSPDQYSFLRETYAFAGTAVPYEPSRDYSLADFLPPLMQATRDHLFVRSPGSDSDPNCNCWGTAYEVNRNAGLFVVFYGFRDKIAELLQDDRYSDLVSQGDNARAVMRNAREAGYKPGDTILLFTGGKLSHSMIYIDRGLVYEKVSIRQNAPFRVNFSHGRAGEIKNFRGNYYLTSDSYQVRRFLDVNKEALPHPGEVPGLVKGGYLEIPLIADSERVGRASLPAEAVDRMDGDFRDISQCIPADRSACESISSQVCVGG